MFSDLFRDGESERILCPSLEPFGSLDRACVFV